MSRYIVGIDLGTTNSALAYVDPEKISDDRPVEVEVFRIPQVVEAGLVQPAPTLPSFLYLPAPGELAPGALDVPWAEGRAFAVGTFARERGMQVPLRLVGSAKSWLCHAGVDRRGAILPFGAPKEVEKVSPIFAATQYLIHLRDAWDHAHPEARLGQQQVYLTVPASFDAVARDLTVEAAAAAGLHVTLLEEPQAAFYAWLARSGESWRKQLRPADRILVADVGGGTTDFSLIEVVDRQGNLELERLAVGEHILLGGDNMDLALAAHLGQRLQAEGKKLDAGQQRALVAATRAAKERLLERADLDSAPITILGRGSKLIGNKITTELSRADAERILVEGFFPRAGLDAEPETRRRAGFLELGLPFAVETGITKHLAQFLRRTGGKLPTHLLFNGGVFNSPSLRARLLEVVSGWGAGTIELADADYDLAVARGAAYFGATKLGRGIRIRGGTARSYYVGIETAMPSIPGMAPPIRAMCVVPFGMEEGTEAEVPGPELGLVVGEPVEFRFLSSTRRKEDAIGAVLDEYEWPEHLTETAPATATLESATLPPGSTVPVKLEVKVTDIGTVELWSAHTRGPERWRLVFNVREREGEAIPEPPAEEAAS